MDRKTTPDKLTVAQHCLDHDFSSIDSATLFKVVGGAPWAEGGAAANLKGNDARSPMVGPGGRAAIGAYGGWLKGAAEGAAKSRGNLGATIGGAAKGAWKGASEAIATDPGGYRPLAE